MTYVFERVGSELRYGRVAQAGLSGETFVLGEAGAEFREWNGLYATSNVTAGTYDVSKPMVFWISTPYAYRALYTGQTRVVVGQPVFVESLPEADSVPTYTFPTEGIVPNLYNYMGSYTFPLEIRKNGADGRISELVIDGIYYDASSWMVDYEKNTVTVNDVAPWGSNDNKLNIELKVTVMGPVGNNQLQVLVFTIPEVVEWTPPSTSGDLQVQQRSLDDNNYDITKTDAGVFEMTQATGRGSGMEFSQGPNKGRHISVVDGRAKFNGIIDLDISGASPDGWIAEPIQNNEYYLKNQGLYLGLGELKLALLNGVDDDTLVFERIEQSFIPLKTVGGSLLNWRANPYSTQTQYVVNHPVQIQSNFDGDVFDVARIHVDFQDGGYSGYHHTYTYKRVGGQEFPFITGPKEGYWRSELHTDEPEPDVSTRSITTEFVPRTTKTQSDTDRDIVLYTYLGGFSNASTSRPKETKTARMNDVAFKTQYYDYIENSRHNRRRMYHVWVHVPDGKVERPAEPRPSPVPSFMAEGDPKWPYVAVDGGNEVLPQRMELNGRVYCRRYMVFPDRQRIALEHRQNRRGIDATDTLELTADDWRSSNTTEFFEILHFTSQITGGGTSPGQWNDFGVYSDASFYEQDLKALHKTVTVGDNEWSLPCFQLVRNKHFFDYILPAYNTFAQHPEYQGTPFREQRQWYDPMAATVISTSDGERFGYTDQKSSVATWYVIPDPGLHRPEDWATNPDTFVPGGMREYKGLLAICSYDRLVENEFMNGTGHYILAVKHSEPGSQNGTFGAGVVECVKYERSLFENGVYSAMLVSPELLMQAADLNTKTNLSPFVSAKRGYHEHSQVDDAVLPMDILPLFLPALSQDDFMVCVYQSPRIGRSTDSVFGMTAQKVQSRYIEAVQDGSNTICEAGEQSPFMRNITIIIVRIYCKHPWIVDKKNDRIVNVQHIMHSGLDKTKVKNNTFADRGNEYSQRASLQHISFKNGTGSNLDWSDKNGNPHPPLGANRTAYQQGPAIVKNNLPSTHKPFGGAKTGESDKNASEMLDTRLNDYIDSRYGGPTVHGYGVRDWTCDPEFYDGLTSFSESRLGGTEGRRLYESIGHVGQRLGGPGYPNVWSTKTDIDEDFPGHDASSIARVGGGYNADGSIPAEFKHYVEFPLFASSTNLFIKPWGELGAKANQMYSYEFNYLNG